MKVTQHQREIEEKSAAMHALPDGEEKEATQLELAKAKLEEEKQEDAKAKPKNVTALTYEPTKPIREVQVTKLQRREIEMPFQC